MGEGEPAHPAKDGSLSLCEVEGEGDEGFYVAQSGGPADLLVSPRGSEAVVRTLLGAGADLNAQYGHLICPMIKEKPVCDGSLGRGRCRKCGYRSSTD